MSYNIAPPGYLTRLLKTLNAFFCIVATLIMIGRSTPVPLSMKTTPRLFERDLTAPVVAVFIEGGGHDHPIKKVPKTVIIPSLQFPALEWADLRGQLPTEAK